MPKCGRFNYLEVEPYILSTIALQYAAHAKVIADAKHPQKDARSLVAVASLALACYGFSGLG